MAHSGTEHGFGVEVVLLAEAAVDPALVADLEALVNLHYGPEVTKRVRAVRAVTAMN